MSWEYFTSLENKKLFEEILKRKMQQKKNQYRQWYDENKKQERFPTFGTDPNDWKQTKEQPKKQFHLNKLKWKPQFGQITVKIVRDTKDPVMLCIEEETGFFREFVPCHDTSKKFAEVIDNAIVNCLMPYPVEELI